MKSLVLASAMVVSFGSVALAEPEEIYPMMEDQVILSLQTEDWVTTDTAEVSVYFDIVQTNEGASELREEVLEKLKKLAPETKWHVTSSSESKDRSGLNRWNISAQARVAEKHVSGLHDRARAASRKGMKVGIGYVNFSPSLAQVEWLKGKMRGTIYKMAAEEAKRLNTAFEGADYRVQLVEFASHPGQVRQLMAQRVHAKSMERADSVSMSAGGQGGGGAQMPVSRKYSLGATVVLSQVAPEAE